MQFLNDLVDLCLCGFYHRCLERFIVLSDLSCTSASCILFDLFMMTAVVPLSAFLSFMAELFFSSFKASISLRDKLLLGLLILISTSCVLTLSK